MPTKPERLNRRMNVEGIVPNLTVTDLSRAVREHTTALGSRSCENAGG